MFFYLAISEIPKTLVPIDGLCPFQSLLDRGIQEKHYWCSSSPYLDLLSAHGHQSSRYWWRKTQALGLNTLPHNFSSRRRRWRVPLAEAALCSHKWLTLSEQMNEWIRKWTSSGFIAFSSDFLLSSFISHFLPIRIFWHGWFERLLLIKEHSHLQKK